MTSPLANCKYMIYLQMAAASHDEFGECSPNGSDYHNFPYVRWEGAIKLKRDPGAWVASNPGRLLTVTTLWLELPDDVDTISDSIARLLNLDTIIVKRGMSLKCLPLCATSLPNLINLHIENCPNLHQLPSHFGDLAGLTIRNCGLSRFHVIKEFVNLTSIEITSCCVRSLYGCITGLTKLKYLVIRDCVALEDLPTDINTLVSLQRLVIEGCSCIKFLPSLAALHNLEDLSLRGCSRLNELPADFDKLIRLRSLNLTDTNIQSLPSTTAKLPNLKKIQLPWCFRLETLPNDLDLNVIHVFLPPAFRLDTLPAKFSVTRSPYYSYQLHRKTSFSEVVDNNGYFQAILYPSLTALPQHRPACAELCRRAIAHRQIPLNQHLNLALTLPLFPIPDESWQEVFDDQTNSKKTLNLLDAFQPGKNKHVMNSPHDASWRESRDSESAEPESIGSASNIVTSKTLSMEATSRPCGAKKRAMDDNCRMRERKSQLRSLRKLQLGPRDGRCESILSARQDGMFLMFTVWAKYKNDEINFKFKPKSSFAELKHELAARLPLEGIAIKIKYLEAPEKLDDQGDPNASMARDWVLMTCDDDLHHCERLSLESMKILLMIQENQANHS